MNPTICGFGTCSVTSDGLYQCSCQEGAMITGSNTDGSLTCIGNVIDALLPPKKLLKSSSHSYTCCIFTTCYNTRQVQYIFSYCDYSVEA